MIIIFSYGHITKEANGLYKDDDIKKNENNRNWNSEYYQHDDINLVS